MRIVSLLPSATEIVCLLGLGDRLVGVSHECDHPPEVRGLRRCVRSRVQTEGLAPAAIDRVVREAMASGASLYEVDEEALHALAPDLIITQDLCGVCAPADLDVRAVAERLPGRPEILSLDPKGLDDVLGSVREVGRAAGVEARATGAVAELRARLEAVRAAVAGTGRRPATVLLEWTDPPFAAGHWCPEQVTLAGGDERLGAPGAPSRQVPWEAVTAARPDFLFASPCGYHLDRALAAARDLAGRPGWQELPAVRAGRAFAVDADSYFARPGPRLVAGVELLAHLLHPDRVPWTGPPDAFAPIA